MDANQAIEAVYAHYNHAMEHVRTLQRHIAQAIVVAASDQVYVSVISDTQRRTYEKNTEAHNRKTRNLVQLPSKGEVLDLFAGAASKVNDKRVVARIDSILKAYEPHIAKLDKKFMEDIRAAITL